MPKTKKVSGMMAALDDYRQEIERAEASDGQRTANFVDRHLAIRLEAVILTLRAFGGGNLETPMHKQPKYRRPAVAMRGPEDAFRVRGNAKYLKAHRQNLADALAFAKAHEND